MTKCREIPLKAKNWISLGLAASLALATAVASAAPWSGWRGSGGWGMGGAYQRNYNPATVETVSGTVEAVELVERPGGASGGVHLRLKTDKGATDVDLGPQWYIERLDTKIEKGDKVEVKGSKVKFGTQEALIAAEVTKGDQKLVLRDGAGVPAWAGWRR